MSEIDRTKSLQELEREDWGEPALESHVVTESHRLRRIPLCEFTAENLRFMIGQQVGLQYLIPLALEYLLADPFVEGDLYPGDLLVAVLKADSKFWLASPSLRIEVERLVKRALSSTLTLNEIDRRAAEDAIAPAQDVFLRAEYFAQHGRA